jgi:hypothetical protein
VDKPKDIVVRPGKNQNVTDEIKDIAKDVKEPLQICERCEVVSKHTSSVYIVILKHRVFEQADTYDRAITNQVIKQNALPHFYCVPKEAVPNELKSMLIYDRILLISEVDEHDLDSIINEVQTAPVPVEGGSH